MSSPLHSHFDTTTLPRERQFRAWREAINVMFDTRPVGAEQAGFRARVDAYLCGEAALGEITAQAQHYDRSRSKLGRDGMDVYVLQFYLEGNCGRRDGGSDTATRPGDLFIVDAVQPLATSTTDSRFLNLVVPRRVLAPLLRTPDALNMRVLRGDSPMVGLLHDHLGALYRRAGTLSAQEAAMVMPATLQLAAAAINGQIDEAHAAAIEESLFSAIRRHLQARLADPDVSPEVVAAHFGISRATLYRLFEHEGGFVHYLRHQRLRQCQAILADTRQIHRRIAEVGSTYGFGDASNFTRAYRRATGMSPRETRMLALQGGFAAPPVALTRDWRSWLVHMR